MVSWLVRKLCWNYLFKFPPQLKKKNNFEIVNEAFINHFRQHDVGFEGKRRDSKLSSNTKESPGCVLPNSFREEGKLLLLPVGKCFSIKQEIETNRQP